MGNYHHLSAYCTTGSIIANINNGGFTNYLDPFLQQEFKEEAFNIRRL